MTSSRLSILTGAFWTVGAFGLSQGLRLGTNIVLAHLLAPELFGIALLINSLRTGVDLLTDVGIGQNVITHAEADEPDYFNTAWTLQIIRGIALWLLCCLMAWPLAYLFGAPILTVALPVSAFYFVLSGFTSMSVFLAPKRMRVKRINFFELTVDVASTIIHVGLALLTPTVWALILGSLMLAGYRMAASFFLLPGLKHSLKFDQRYFRDILNFGKWIFISSILYYFAMSYDRLYLAKVAPLAILGIYGIARSFADLATALVGRMSTLVIFPLIASNADQPRRELRAKVSSLRLMFVLLVAAGLGAFGALADLMISLVYDERYHAAGWMISVLSVGAWISILCSINESTLMGLKQPLYGATANGFKFAWLTLGLPLAYLTFGILGVTVAVAFSDLARLAPIAFGQRRLDFSFFRQDALGSLVLLVTMGLIEALRWSLGFGTSFDSLAAMLSK
jgi:O-antigen/teichoic acid export membrane protein